MDGFLDSHVFLVVAIFVARVFDVSLGTLRTILVFRGHRYVAALIGFVEILIWIVAASKVLQNLDTWYFAVAYAAGFAAGNIVGIYLDGKLAIGTDLVRAVSSNPDAHLATHLSGLGYEVIELAGKGTGGSPVEVLLVVEKRRRIPALLRSIDEIDPEAYCTTSDVKEKANSYGTGLIESGDLPVPPKRK